MKFIPENYSNETIVALLDFATPEGVALNPLVADNLWRAATEARKALKAGEMQVFKRWANAALHYAQAGLSYSGQYCEPELCNCCARELGEDYVGVRECYPSDAYGDVRETAFFDALILNDGGDRCLCHMCELAGTASMTREVELDREEDELEERAMWHRMNGGM